jgi:hypothetical protein
VIADAVAGALVGMVASLSILVVALARRTTYCEICGRRAPPPLCRLHAAGLLDRLETLRSRAAQAEPGGPGAANPPEPSGTDQANRPEPPGNARI